MTEYVFIYFSYSLLAYYYSEIRFSSGQRRGERRGKEKEKWRRGMEKKDKYKLISLREISWEI